MLRMLALSTAVALGLGAAAYADDHHHDDDMPGADWITMDQALQKLHALGYKQVVKLKADDGFWKAKVVKDGAVYKVRLDPRSGDVAAKEKDDDN